MTVYVDNDPTVAAHGRALLAGDPHTYFTVADLRSPSAVLNDHIVAGAIDFHRPLALIQAGTLHHVEDQDQPAEIMRAYTAALPPGSYVVLTSFHSPADGSAAAVLAEEIERRFRGSSMGMTPHPAWLFAVGLCGGSRARRTVSTRLAQPRGR
ncbi:SAM-dependent methyltransferase [Saccharopolyspora endophytica]|uniref:SAM-dependent methyltransferase n=1 Tax=Saccharopolyspora endophytica TaxID=543886 RepID=A0ABS5DK78_9PSEU|nr:SAM-dependent methyltransferase [Saccharopolyspora endophytica]